MIASTNRAPHPLRVALFTRYPANPNHPRGGVESVAVVLVRALARLNDLEVHVVTLEDERGTVAVQTVGSVKIHRLPTPHWPQLADILLGPGRRRLAQYLRQLQPDVVHTHETYGLTLPRLPMPHVFTVHGFDHANLVADSAAWAWLRSPLWRRIERYGLGRQQHIVSISPYVRGLLEPQTRATIYDIDNPVDERFFNVRHRPEPGRVLCVGWINHRKNTLGAVQAVAQARAHGVAVTLAVAGQPKETAYYDQVIACIEENGLRDHIEFLGHVDHEQLQHQLGRAAVFLLPSRQENSPMAIAEAMAVGVPVIAANRCGMPFMVEDGSSGYLIDPEDPDQIARRLATILGDPRVASSMGERGRAIAEARFHPDAVARKTREVYHGLCQPALTCGAPGATSFESTN